MEISMLMRMHARAVFTSCELGLHWERANDARRPFDVLLNLENLKSSPLHVKFARKQRVKVPVPSKLIELALGFSKNMSAHLNK
jgi:hypothetical protein